MQNIPQRGRGLGHVTPKIFGIQSNISLKLHKLETSAHTRQKTALSRKKLC